MGLVETYLVYSFQNLAKNKARSLAATAGICVALFLIFVQWGFLESAKKQITLLYDYFDYDIVVLADTYQFMFTAKPFDSVRLIQAGVLPSVEDTFQLNFATALWERNDTEQRSSLMLFGLDHKPEFIANNDVRRGLAQLKRGRGILVDEYSHTDFGPLATGTKAKINRQQVEIVSHFQLGMFFYTEGSALVDNTSFGRLTFRPSRETSFGLIRLKDGFDAQQEKAKLSRLLPDDVLVLTKTELIAREQEYFVNVKPLGIIFRTGVFVAFLTGTVILLQVISTDIGTRFNEYATLKAMGFGSDFIYGSAILQTLIIVLTALAGATLITKLLFARVHQATHLPADMTGELFTFVLLLALLKCFVISLLILRKLSLADPAALF